MELRGFDMTDIHIIFTSTCNNTKGPRSSKKKISKLNYPRLLKNNRTSIFFFFFFCCISITNTVISDELKIQRQAEILFYSACVSNLPSRFQFIPVLARPRTSKRPQRFTA